MQQRWTFVRLARAAAGALIVVAAACSDSTEPPAATTVALSVSTVSLDALGATQTVTVIVTDQHGNAMPAGQVAWSSSDAAVNVVAGSGSTAVVTAAANGTATITAALGNASASIAVTVAQIPAALQKTTGDAQLGAAGTTLTQPLGVRVVDRLGYPIPHAPVAFAVTSGGGSVAAPNAMTQSDGTAATSWTLGKVVSTTQQVTASANGVPSINFSASVTTGAPATVMIAAGNMQTGVVGTTLGIAPQVLVLDAFTNPVSGAVVTFSAVGGGSVQFTSATTNASGIATAGTWTLGTTSGATTMVANVGGLQPIVLTAAALPGAAKSMSVFAGNNQTAATTGAVSVAPAVKLVDAYGNPVSGVLVTFTVSGGAGALSGSPASSDANGIAAVTRWTLGAIAGTNTLTASAGGLTSVTFTATAAGAPTPATTPTSSTSGGLSVNGVSMQAAMAGATLPIKPSVIVRDTALRPVPGVKVTFTVASGGGTVTSATVTSDASGIATVGSWTLGPAAMLNTLTASAPNFGTYVFGAAGCEGAGGSAFQITLCYRTTMTPSQRQAFVDAAARWRSIITAKLPDVFANLPQGYCGASSPQINMTVDDLLIFAGVEPIDGAGGILGSAGWCLRRGGGLPAVGDMQFDAADVAQLEASGRFPSVILHEMGHVLGIGTMWSIKGLLQQPASSGGLPDTYFSGTAATAAFNSIGGAMYTAGQKVPVENTGGAGTINVHWRESVLQNELMTGWLNSGANPLSVVTVRSLEDLGYSVNAAAADPFTLGAALRSVQTFDFGAVSLMNDARIGVQATIDPSGRVTRIR